MNGKGRKLLISLAVILAVVLVAGLYKTLLETGNIYVTLYGCRRNL